MNTMYNPYHTAIKQFDRIAELLNLKKSMRDFLRSTQKEYHFTIRIPMSTGETGVFRGFRVIHNDSRGPAKGGVRFHPEETIDTVRAMSMWMTWKCAVMDLPLGGANGGIICDPHNLSGREQQALCREWVRQLSNNIGPVEDVPGPDVMTNSRHMLWMLDEYETIYKKKYPGFITGKPLGMGGSAGKIESTGYGIIFTIREALKELDGKISGSTAVIQGFGTVAQYAAELFVRLGGKVTAVSCWEQKEGRAVLFRDRDGLDIGKLRSFTDSFGTIDIARAKQENYEIGDGEDWIEEEADILIPAALENSINSENVNRISDKVKLIAEGANGPTSPEADEVIRKKGIFLIPDFLANAGGVTCSYFEQVQSNMNYFWEREEVLAKLDTKMTSAFLSVLDYSEAKKLSVRDAAYVIAVNRVAESCRSRGWIE